MKKIYNHTKPIFYSLAILLVFGGQLNAQTLIDTDAALAVGSMIDTAASGAGNKILKDPLLSNKKPTEQNVSDKKNVSTSDAVDQIQKTLLFSDENSANKKSIQRRSALTVDRSGDEFRKPRLEMLVTDPKPNQQLEQKLKIAYNASVSGQYEVAVELYKQIIKSDPQNYYVQFALAACYQNLGQYKQAKTIYYKLLQREEQTQQTKNELIGNLIAVISEESPIDAIYLLEKLANENQESDYILAGTAMAYDKIKKSDQAILLLKKAININPAEVKYKFNLAIIYDKISDEQNALAYYQDVIKNYVANGNLDNSIPIDQVKQRVEFIKNKA